MPNAIGKLLSFTQLGFHQNLKISCQHLEQHHSGAQSHLDTFKNPQKKSPLNWPQFAEPLDQLQRHQLNPDQLQQRSVNLKEMLRLLLSRALALLRALSHRQRYRKPTTITQRPKQPLQPTPNYEHFWSHFYFWRWIR